MRQIGTLPNTVDASAFVDHLVSLGMKSRIDQRPDGWDLWIYNEDHVSAARKELSQFLENSTDPRYQEAAKAAEDVRRKEAQLDRSFRKNYRDASDLWAAPSLRMRPATIVTMAICVIVFLLQQSPSTRARTEFTLRFSTVYFGADGRIHDSGLNDIRQGEVWRLVTPVFMHASPLHIFFNVWMLSTFGTLIELRRGSLRLVGLMLIVAVVSNFGEFFWLERADPDGIHGFLGFSGVVYGLFGYIWMKSIYEPEQGLTIHPNNIAIMLFWLVLCMTGTLGPIANAAHVMGLAAGAVLGLLRY